MSEFTETSVRPEDRQELGGTGTSFFGGQLSGEEYNKDLRGPKAIAVYDKMRRSDGTVKAVLLVCTLPIRSADWSVAPASDAPIDQEIADFVEENLLRGMTITWDSFLHHALLCLPFGYSMFEKVWEIKNGKLQYRKLAPRMQKTLYKWYLDDTGGLESIEQFVLIGTEFKFVTIPSEKLLVFTNEKEGSNFEGISLLRAAYKHYFYKEQLYRIDGLAAERQALGIPAFTHPSVIDEQTKKDIDAIGRHLHANEQLYVRLPDNVTFDIKGLTGVVKDLLPSIGHHDAKIAQSVLASFLNLSTGAGTGSYALSRDQSSLFLMALKSVAQNICDTVNRYAIPQLVAYNYGENAAIPELVCSGLDRRDVKELGQAVEAFARAELLHYTPETEQNIREGLGLPALSDEAVAKIEDEMNKPPPPPPPLNPPVPAPGQVAEPPKVAPEQPPKEPPVNNSENIWHRELTLAEKKVAFVEIKGALDTAQTTIVAAAQDVKNKQIAKLVELAMKDIAARDAEKASENEVPYVSQMTAVFSGEMTKLVRYGRNQVKSELSKTKLAEPISDTADITDFLKARARATSTVLAAKLRSAVTFESLRQIRMGITDENALTSALTSVSDRELKNCAAYSVTEAFNYGRSIEAQSHADEIERVQYSAILDGNTCQICRPLDGQEWDYSDDRTDLYAGGNPECEGGPLCRCVLVYIGKESA